EEDPRDRRVERRRDPGRTAREDQPALPKVAREARGATAEGERARADVDRRTFPADRQAREETERQEDHLAGEDARREDALARRAVGDVERRDHLRNASAFGARKEAIARLADQDEPA